MTDEHFTIIIRGQIDVRWIHWFDENNITQLPNDQTQITGTIVDDAAFNSLLSKIRDLGLSIVYLERLDRKPNSTEPFRKG